MKHESQDGALPSELNLADPPGAQCTRVWLVDDCEEFRQTYAQLLLAATDFKCDRQFGSAEEVISALEGGSAPDVILLDDGLPGLTGASAVKTIKLVSPSTRVFVFSVFRKPTRVAEAMAGGAHGFFAKDKPIKEVAGAMRAALRGQEQSRT